MKEAFKPVWGLFFILLFAVLVVGLIQLLQPKDIVPWRTDFEAARDEATREGKPVIAYFTAAWCAPCQRMSTTTWADEEVEAALRDYVPVKIDIDRDQRLAMQYGVGPIPYVVVLDETGAVIRGSVGAMTSEEFVSWLR